MIKVKYESFIDKVFKTINKNLEKDAEVTAENIKKEMISTVPVRTGKLRSTIKKYKSKYKNNKSYIVWAGSDEAYYVSFIEFGTKKISAKPFIRRAVERNRGKYIQKLKKTIKG